MTEPEESLHIGSSCKLKLPELGELRMFGGDWRTKLLAKQYATEFLCGNLVKGAAQ